MLNVEETLNLIRSGHWGRLAPRTNYGTRQFGGNGFGPNVADVKNTDPDFIWVCPDGFMNVIGATTPEIFEMALVEYLEECKANWITSDMSCSLSRGKGRKVVIHAFTTPLEMLTGVASFPVFERASIGHWQRDCRNLDDVSAFVDHVWSGEATKIRKKKSGK